MKAPTYGDTMQPVGLKGSGGSAISVRAQRFRPNTSGLGEEWKAVADAGQSLQGVAKDVDAWGMAEQKSRLMKAKVGAFADLSRFKTELEAETDPRELARKWSEGSQEIFERHGQTIADAPGVADGWELYRQEEMARFDAQVGSLRQKRIIDQGVGTLIGGIEDLAELLPGVRDEQGFTDIMARGLKLITDARYVGFISHKEAESEFKKWGVRVMTAKGMQDMEADANGTIARLGDMNEYKGLTSEARRKLQDRAEKIAKEQNLEKAYAFVKARFSNPGDAAEYLDDSGNLKKHGLDLKDGLNLANRFKAEEKEAERKELKAKKEESEVSMKEIYTANRDGYLTREYIDERYDSMTPTQLAAAYAMLDGRGPGGIVANPRRAIINQFKATVPNGDQPEQLYMFEREFVFAVEAFEKEKKRKATAVERYKIADELMKLVEDHWLDRLDVYGYQQRYRERTGYKKPDLDALSNLNPYIRPKEDGDRALSLTDSHAAALADPRVKAAQQLLIQKGKPITPGNIKTLIDRGYVK